MPLPYCRLPKKLKHAWPITFASLILCPGLVSQPKLASAAETNYAAGIVTQPLFLEAGRHALAAPADTVYPRTYQIFTKTDQQPSFPGGDMEMDKFIRQHLKYPKDALRNGVEGLVVLQFVVDRNGKISDPQVVKKLGMGTDEEAVRVVTLFPDFLPAIQNGKPVEFRYTLPIRYGLVGRRRAKNL